MPVECKNCRNNTPAKCNICLVQAKNHYLYEPIEEPAAFDYAVSVLAQKIGELNMTSCACRFAKIAELQRAIKVFHNKL